MRGGAQDLGLAAVTISAAAPTGDEFDSASAPIVVATGITVSAGLNIPLAPVAFAFDLTYKTRIPVQFLEMAWWILGIAVFLAIWPTVFVPGTYALGVLAWYGGARFFLEPMREEVDVIFGCIAINQLVAAILTIGAVGALIARH